MKNLFNGKTAKVILFFVLLLVVCFTNLPFSGANNQSAIFAASNGGSLKIAIIAGPTTFFMPKSRTTLDNQITMPALESLGRLNSKGSYEPWLAESFQVDPDHLTFTIKLRPNVFFHDGSKLTADVVKWNFEQIIKNGKATEVGDPKSFDVVDPLTLVVHFDKWANNWPDVISDIQIMSKEAYEKNGEAWCAVNLVGTGPFVMKKYIQGSQVLYERFDKYRLKGLPRLNSLEIDIIPDLNTQITALQNKDTDCLMTNNGIAIQTLERAGFKNMGKQSPNLADICYFLFNSKDPAVPFSKLKVRQAVMHSIDYKNVAKVLTYGLGIATNQFGVPGAYSYNSKVKFYDYNIKRAKQLLKEAGYPNGFDTTIYTRAEIQDSAVPLQASLKAIGINAAIKVLDAALLDKMQVNESIPGIVMGKGASQLDFTKNYIRLYSSEGIKNKGIIGFPPDYEKALFGARAAKTMAEKKALLQEASQMLVEKYCLLVPTAVAFYKCYTQDKVHDLGVYQVSIHAWTPEQVWVSK